MVIAFFSGQSFQEYLYQIALENRNHVSPEQKAGLGTVPQNKDSVSLHGKYWAGLLTAHYKIWIPWEIPNVV